MSHNRKGPAFPSIQMLRGLAALLIVVWHSDLALERFAGDYWRDVNPLLRAQLYPFWANHLCIGVDLFFCISGFIMAMLARKASSGADAWSFLRDRAARILPPYWFFTVLFVFLYAQGLPFHFWRMTGLLSLDVPAVVYSWFLLPQKNGPVLAIGWTLLHEFMFYYFVFLVILCGQGRRLPLFTGIAAAFGVLLCVTGTELLQGYAFSYYFAEFFAGALAFHFHKKISSLLPELQLLGACAGYFVWSAVMDRNLQPPDVHLLTVFGASLLCFFGITGMIGLDRKYNLARRTAGRFAAWLGDSSYSLYLSHWFTLSFIGLGAQGISNAPTPVIVLWHVGAVLVTVAVGALIGHCVELPVHRRLSALWKKTG